MITNHVLGGLAEVSSWLCTVLDMVSQCSFLIWADGNAIDQAQDALPADFPDHKCLVLDFIAKSIGQYL